MKVQAPYTMWAHGFTCAAFAGQTIVCICRGQWHWAIVSGVIVVLDIVWAVHIVKSTP